MELSVIIVNYNVKHFLEQCLHSVEKASRSLDVEIFVVDNNSVDGSSQLIKEKFSRVQLIENKQNVGFSKANNQAIRRANGKYILLLNPDTVVEEDTFQKVIYFMNQHPDAGGLGVKMIDGKGNFLPESKRGLPTPWVAFSKIFGLSRLFPKSKKFGKYHLSYLDENEIHEVNVLAGAFMLLRKEALEKVGLLDETFFMYGEDIDLSYRITQGGYKNYYFPKTTIIHYKGESTKKGSLNYVKVFYKAMVIFAQKHFSGGRASIFSVLIHLAIYFRAFLSIVNRVFTRISVPLLDGLFIFAGYLILTPLWEDYKFQLGYYPSEFLQFVVPVYILIWLLAIFVSGGYKKPVNLLSVGRGVLWGAISILLIYSLVDERFRFSRALILLGTAWAAFVLILYRLIFYWLKIKSFGIDIKKVKKIAIAGHPDEAKRVKSVLQQTQIKSDFVGFIAIDETDFSEDYIGSVSQLNEIVRINRLNEIIFCSGSISSGEIIRYMLELTSLDIDFKIAPPESISIIGSNSIHTAGDLYVVHVNTISKKSNRRKKRFFDVGTSLFLLVFSPVLILGFKHKSRYFSNLVRVLTGTKTLVGYIPDAGNREKLPSLKPGILTPADIFSKEVTDSSKDEKLNMLYARDYHVSTDVEIVFKNWKKLDD